MQSKPQWDTTSHLLGWLLSKKTRDKCWWQCGEKGTLNTLEGNVNWCSHYGKQYGGYSINLKTELPYNPAISPLGIYPKEMKTLSLRDICIHMFVAALFTIAKTWKQS